jgi:hypothetical protein
VIETAAATPCLNKSHLKVSFHLAFSLITAGRPGWPGGAATSKHNARKHFCASLAQGCFGWVEP